MEVPRDHTAISICVQSCNISASSVKWPTSRYRLMYLETTHSPAAAAAARASTVTAVTGCHGNSLLGGNAQDGRGQYKVRITLKQLLNTITKYYWNIIKYEMLINKKITNNSVTRFRYIQMLILSFFKIARCALRQNTCETMKYIFFYILFLMCSSNTHRRPTAAFTTQNNKYMAKPKTLLKKKMQGG